MSPAPQKLIDTPPNRILVIAVPAIGDTLVALPLIHSLSHAFPKAKFDILTQGGREGYMLGQDCIENVITYERGAPFTERLSLAKKLLRKYDLAVSTSGSDRAFFFSLIAAPVRASLMEERSAKNWWKHSLTQIQMPLAEDTHVVLQNLSLADALGAKRSFEISAPSSGIGGPRFEEVLPIDSNQDSFSVIHMPTAAEYKQWPESYWHKVIEFLLESEQHIVLTGGPGEQEKKMLERAQEINAESITPLPGVLSFYEISRLLRKAKLCIAADTAMAHISAALGTETIVVFGPSNVVKWAPWPYQFKASSSPYSNQPLQTVDNVTIICPPCSCQPFKGHCEKPEGNFSACMNALSAETVIKALKEETDPLKSMANP